MLKFTDIGTVGYAKGAHVDDAAQRVRELASVAKFVPIVGSVIGSALGAVASIGVFAESIFSSGNAAGLSQQQLDALAKPPPELRPYDTGQRLALVEGKDGTKKLRGADGLDYVVGGAGIGGPGRLRSRLDQLEV